MSFYKIPVAIPYEDNVRYSGMKSSIVIENWRVQAGEISAMQKIETLLLGGAV